MGFKKAGIAMCCDVRLGVEESIAFRRLAFPSRRRDRLPICTDGVHGALGDARSLALLEKVPLRKVTP